MGLFKNAHDSHRHSLDVLNMIYDYDSFLDGIGTVADVGCGIGLDTEWWATLHTRDDPPEHREIAVYAMDLNIDQIEPHILEENPKVIPRLGNFEIDILPSKVDLVWSHDSLQYAYDPIGCLRNWRKMLNTNGMLVLTVAQTTYLHNNRLVVENYSHQYYSYNILNLMYMLAIAGFDCRDAYFYRKENTPWLYAGVYASEHEPLPKNPTWYDLAERNLINDSIIRSVNSCGYARLQDVVVAWFDKNLYQITS